MTVWYLVLVFWTGSAAATTIPMYTEEACLAAAKNVKAERAYCVNSSNGSVSKP